jgi:hypothetical protein
MSVPKISIVTYLSSSLNLILLAKDLTNEGRSGGLVAGDDLDIIVGRN